MNERQNKMEERKRATRQIEQETDAEVAFGVMLEQSGVDCDAFMGQWQINRNQFNRTSHCLYGLTDGISGLPPALSALLTIRRQPRAA